MRAIEEIRDDFFLVSVNGFNCTVVRWILMDDELTAESIDEADLK